MAVAYAAAEGVPLYRYLGGKAATLLLLLLPLPQIQIFARGTTSDGGWT